MKIQTNRYLPIQLTMPIPMFGDGEAGATDVIDPLVVRESPDGGSISTDGGIERTPGERLADFGSLKAAPEDGSVDDKPADDKPAADAEVAAKAKDEDDKPAAAKAQDEEAKKQAEANKDEYKPPTDEEIDKIEAHHKAPPHVKSGIKNLKGIAKDLRGRFEKTAAELATEREAKATLAKEAEELREKIKVAGVPEEVQKELEELREERRVYLLEQDPEINKALEEGLAKAEEGVFKFLIHKRLKPEVIEKIKADGFDNWDGWNALAKKIEELGFTTKTEFEELLRERRAVIKGHERTLADLKTKKDGQQQFHEQREVASREAFAQKFTGEVSKAIATEHAWMEIKKVPAGAMPDQKAEIEKHNEEVRGLVKEFQPNMQGLYQRDPATTAKIVLDALRARRLTAEVAAKDTEIAKIKAGAEKAEKRVKELEERIAKTKAVGRIESQPSGEVTPAKEGAAVAEDGTVKPAFPWQK